MKGRKDMNEDEKREKLIKMINSTYRVRQISDHDKQLDADEIIRKRVYSYTDEKLDDQFQSIKDTAGYTAKLRMAGVGLDLKLTLASEDCELIPVLSNVTTVNSRHETIVVSRINRGIMEVSCDILKPLDAKLFTLDVRGMHMMLQSIDIINAMCIALTNGYIEKSHELWEKSTGNENDYIIADYEVINDMASAMKFKLMISDCDIDELSVWYTFKIFIRLLMLRLLYQNNNKTILIGKETASLIRMVSSVIRNWEMKHSVNLITGSHERYVYRPEEIQKSLKENTEKMFNFLVNTASLESGNVRYADNILYYTDKYLDELNELKISLDKFDSDLTKARLEKIEGIDIQPKNVKFLKKGKLDETRKI